MLYFLYGKDNYRLLQREKELKEKAAFKEEGVLDMALLESRAFWDIFYQPSIFAEKRTIILRNVLENPVFAKEFLKKTEELEQAADLLIFSQKGKDKLPFKLSHAEAFPLLPPGEARLWLKSQAKALGAEIDNNAAESLFDLCSSDLFCLSSEIKKLACFSSKINREAIEKVSFTNKNLDIFAALDSLSRRNKKEALSLLQNHLDKGESPLYLFSMIAFQVRNLLLIKNFFHLGPEKLSLHPFVFKKLAFLRNSFENQELEQIFSNIFEADYKIKTGRLMPEEALFDFVASL